MFVVLSVDFQSTTEQQEQGAAGIFKVHLSVFIHFVLKQ